MQKQYFKKFVEEAKFKASSLINAIFTCLIISVFSGCLVLISHYHNALNNNLFSQEELINNNNSSFNYILNNSQEKSYNELERLNVFNNEKNTYWKKIKWGFYDIIICKTIFKNDTILKTALIGEKSHVKNKLALYLTDYNKPLKLSGKTEILGDLKIPYGQTEQSYINNNLGNSIKIKGNELKSTKKIPKIKKDIIFDISNLPHIPLNNIKKDAAIINEFDKEPKVIDLSNYNAFNNITCKGNIVLTSSKTLEIDSSTRLNDVLIIAPKVRIKSDFKGNIQIIAKEEVIVEENVFLQYPSSIYIKNDIDSVSVIIKENAKLIGGIVIDGNIYTSSLKRSLSIEKNATIVGEVYCYGKTQLKGKIIGTIYTDRFFLKNESSSYENVILNGSINRDSLPGNFIELALFENPFDKKKYEVIKEF
ncbi:hypothetical protein D7030_08320 [Flavobacteriaceae bacterium AU392]|nr:hypothetical protein D1817_00095 [Flavobacteriaceae bacterium]RKM85124.1 hypothetical protein D7030_08320 [Flavobacteriaceae bacterium AU392]